MALQIVAHIRDAVVAVLRVTAEDEVEEHVDVLARVSARGAHQPVGPVVVVVRRVGRDRHDRLSPSTPVVAAASGSVPLKEVPVIPTLPVAHSAVTSSPPSAVEKPRARPFSQSTTAFGASDSFAPPIVGHPSDCPVPGDWEWTTAKPRGTHVPTCELEMTGWSAMWGIVGGKGSRGWGLAADLLTQVPEVVEVQSGDPGVVRARFVDDGNPEPFRLGLRGPGDIHMHPVRTAVAVGVELGLYPEVVANPLGRVGEGGHDLRLALLDDVGGSGQRRARRRAAPQREPRRRARRGGRSSLAVPMGG